MSDRRRLLMALINQGVWLPYSYTYLYHNLIPTEISGKTVGKKARVSKVYANGVIENQLFISCRNSFTQGDFVCTQIDDGRSLSITGTNSTGSNVYISIVASSGVNPDSLVSGHKYLKFTNQNQLGSYFTGFAGHTFNAKNEIFTATTIDAQNFSFVLIVPNGTTLTNFVITPQLVDLTKYDPFDTPTTLTDNRIQALLNRGYIPCNTGEYKGTDIGVVSSEPYNIWNNSLANGFIDGNGAFISSTNDCRTDYIAVIPSRSYTFGNENFTIVNGRRIFEYDENKNFIKNTNHWNTTTDTITLANNTRYVAISYNGTAKPNNPEICIHLTGTRTGYAPHQTFTPITFKYQGNGAGTSHDTYEITKTEHVFTRNMWKYTFSGSESWSSGGATTAGMYRYYTQITDMQSGNGLQGLCNKYQAIYYPTNIQSFTQEAVMFGYSNKYLQFISTSNLSTSDVAILFNNVKIIYPLATPQVIRIPRKHLGVVDLGSLGWTYSNGTFRPIGLTNVKQASSYSAIPNMYCIKYMCVSNQTLDGGQDLSFSITDITSSYVIRFRDNSFNGSTDDFKNAMAGIYLFYETNTEVADINNIVDIESGGTINTNWFSLVENQLVVNGNFESASGWYFANADTTMSISNNVATITKGTNAVLYIYRANADFTNFVANHKYLATAKIKSSSNFRARFRSSNSYGTITNISANTLTTLLQILSPTTISGFYCTLEDDNSITVGSSLEVSDYEFIDLTVAFPDDTPTSTNDPRIQYIINQGYIPTNTTGTYKLVNCEVLPNVDLDIKCK